MKAVDTLIISDLHLGVDNSQAKLSLQTMEQYSFRQLIIVGDLHEKCSKICDDQWKVFTYLRENRKKIIYVVGNHDPVGDFIGVEMCQEYIWKVGDKTFCAKHGDEFDRLLFIISEPLVDKAMTKAFYFFAGKKYFCAPTAQLAWVHEWYLSHFAQRARRYAKKHHFDVIICGHTHHPEHITFTDKKTGKTIDYWNTGCWIKNGKCSYIIMDEQGNMELKYVS